MHLKQQLSELKHSADWVGLREVRETTWTKQAKNGHPEGQEKNDDHGVMVEVLKDGQFAYCAVNNCSTSSLQQALNQACTLAEQAKAYKLFSFDQSERPQAEGRHQSFAQIPLQEKDLNQVMGQLCHLSGKGKIDSAIIVSKASAMCIKTQTRFVSTNGSDSEQSFDSVVTNLETTAKVNDEIQNRTTGAMANCRQQGLEVINLAHLEKEAIRIAAQAIELTSAENCPEASLDLVLAPDQMYLQIHESIGHPLEIDRILGDERNYAGWSFVKLSDFGHLKYGSPLLNVTFDPNVSGEFASYQFDDIGNRAVKEYLIKDGILERGIGSLESQKRANIKGVASQRAQSWNRAPIDRMGNINLEPGASSFQEMISSVEKGIYMSTNRSWSIDDYRNKFQFGCEYARLIENGKLTKTVKNPNYRGISTPFWSSLDKVGDASSFELWGSPYCGKGEPNQIIRVGHATPACLFKNIEVFGGHS